jgi:two-component system sensor histidine kinase RpfC
MSQAVTANNPVQFSLYAHALKGSAANLGLSRLQTQALCAEQLPQDRLSEQGLDQIANLRTAFNQGISELSRLLENPRTPFTAP